MTESSPFMNSQSTLSLVEGLQFTGHKIAAKDVLNFKECCTKYYKNVCISKETGGGNKVTKKYKVYFQIGTLFRFEYKSEKKG